jgi:hypothetical protein
MGASAWYSKRRPPKKTTCRSEGLSKDSHVRARTYKTSNCSWRLTFAFLITHPVSPVAVCHGDVGAISPTGTKLASKPTDNSLLESCQALMLHSEAVYVSVTIHSPRSRMSGHFLRIFDAFVLNQDLYGSLWYTEFLMTEPLVKRMAPKSFFVEYLTSAPMFAGIPKGMRLRISS